MNDELTPELKEAMDKLPRERMPSGLEARVTDAMREHGFLAKRRRTIAITNSRVAGLVAACVALMIGGYSIGLYRGGGDQVLPGVATMERDDGGRTNEPAVGALEEKEGTGKRARSVVDETREAESMMAKDDGRRVVPESRPEEAVGTSTAPTARPDEARADQFRQVEAEKGKLAENARNIPSSPAREEPAAKAMLNESADRAQSRPATATPEVSKRPLTFLLNGTPVVIDAPDSVRITQDELGRMLLIYTSDGIIRIRLAEDD